MSTLYFQLTNDIDDELYEDEVFEAIPEDASGDLPLVDEDEGDIICPECGSLIEDGVQCEVCGFMVGI